MGNKDFKENLKKQILIVWIKILKCIVWVLFSVISASEAIFLGCNETMILRE